MLILNYLYIYSFSTHLSALHGICIPMREAAKKSEESRISKITEEVILELKHER